MIARVALLPHPPLLVPELVGGTDQDVTALRSTCLTIAGELPQHWVVIGVGERSSVFGPETAGTFLGYGVDVPVHLGVPGAQPDPELPLPVLVAGWLRGAVDAARVSVELVANCASSAECAAFGADLVRRHRDTEVGLLVLGDGSHRHGERAVGRPDERAGDFDATVAKAIAAVDTDTLADLDRVVAAELGAVGRAPWQVLAGAIAEDGRTWRCVDSHLLIPFGVAYHCALLEPTP